MLSQKAYNSSPGRTPTTSTSESSVSVAKAGMPWEQDGGPGKYKYHPGGDSGAAPKDAPSAINVVVVPNVDLPKVWTAICSSVQISHV